MEDCKSLSLCSSNTIELHSPSMHPAPTHGISGVYSLQLPVIPVL